MLIIKYPTEEEEEEEGEEEEDAGGAKEGGGEKLPKEAEGANVKGDDEPVHEGWICDGCKMCPIVGARYKCLEWVLFVCNWCITDGVLSSVALRALITTCVRGVQPKEPTQLSTVC